MYHFTDLSLPEFAARVAEFTRRNPHCKVAVRFVGTGDLHLSYRDEDNTPRLAALWYKGSVVPADDLLTLRDEFGADLAQVADYAYEEEDAVCADYAARSEAATPRVLSAPQSRRRGFPSSR